MSDKSPPKPSAKTQSNITQPQLDPTADATAGAPTAGVDKDPVATAQTSAAHDPALGAVGETSPGAAGEVNQGAAGETDQGTAGETDQGNVDKPTSGVAENDKKDAETGSGVDESASGAGENASSVNQDQARETDPRPDIAKVPPPRELRPGEIGYAPPARVANFSGVLTNEHLGYHPGTDASVNIHGQVPLAMPAPADATLSSSTAGMKPSLLSKQSATVALSKMWADMQAWIMDIPFPMEGQLAVVVQFARDMKARQVAMSTAHQLGRTLEPDAVDKATFDVPAEYFHLRGAAGEIAMLQKIYSAALAAKGIELSSDDQRSVDQIMSHFEGLSDGPKSPDDVAEDDHPAQAA